MPHPALRSDLIHRPGEGTSVREGRCRRPPENCCALLLGGCRHHHGKIGDASVRVALYQAAHVIVIKPVKGCRELKSWAMRIAKRAGHRKAKVALALKLAVIMHARR